VLEKALSLREKGEGDPVSVAQLRFLLARALVAAGREPGRALDLANAAREAFDAAGARVESERAEVEAWLAKRPAR
jgi:hypothetical protein